MRSGCVVGRTPDDWRVDAQVATRHRQDVQLCTAWTARCADGTVCDIATGEAQSALDSGRALRVGRVAIRWLQPGEDRLDVLRAEAARIAGEQGQPHHMVQLLLAKLNHVAVEVEPEAGPVAAATLVHVHEEATRARGTHRRILRRHASELRKAHGLRADDPISALALPRHARRPPLNAKHWGRMMMGAAICSGFTRDAVKLAGR